MKRYTILLDILILLLYTLAILLQLNRKKLLAMEEINMKLSREEREQLLADLLNPEIDHTTRSEHLQKLRVSLDTADGEIDDFTKSNAKLKTDNEDLIISNSKLFRQLGVVGAPEDKKEEEKVKEFSETVTIETLEKGV
jgi:phage I-like protein